MPSPEYTEAMEQAKAGHWGPMIGIALRARLRNWEKCECAEPEFNGNGIMCLGCLRENVKQRIRREEEIQAPHAFDAAVRDGRELGLCEVCAGWPDDERHRGGNDA